jgi:hypothetical protein
MEPRDLGRAARLEPGAVGPVDVGITAGPGMVKLSVPIDGEGTLDIILTPNVFAAVVAAGMEAGLCEFTIDGEPGGRGGGW